MRAGLPVVRKWRCSGFRMRLERVWWDLDLVVEEDLVLEEDLAEEEEEVGLGGGR